MTRRVIKLKKNTEKEVVEFIEAQSNFTDAMVFLIQQEIHKHGIRNLSEHIPAIRTKDFFCEDTKKDGFNKKEMPQKIVCKDGEKKDTNETNKIDIESIYGG